MDWTNLQPKLVEALRFLNDESAAEQIARRVAAQYGPAALTAPDEAARDRVWESLRFYLTARPTLRKAFALDDVTSERVLNAVQSVVGLP